MPENSLPEKGLPENSLPERGLPEYSLPETGGPFQKTIFFLENIEFCDELLKKYQCFYRSYVISFLLKLPTPNSICFVAVMEFRFR